MSECVFVWQWTEQKGQRYLKVMCPDPLCPSSAAFTFEPKKQEDKRPLFVSNMHFQTVEGHRA